MHTVARMAGCQLRGEIVSRQLGNLETSCTDIMRAGFASEGSDHLHPGQPA